MNDLKISSVLGLASGYLAFIPESVQGLLWQLISTLISYYILKTVHKRNNLTKTK